MRLLIGWTIAFNLFASGVILWLQHDYLVNLRIMNSGGNNGDDVDATGLLLCSIGLPIACVWIVAFLMLVVASAKRTGRQHVRTLLAGWGFEGITAMILMVVFKDLFGY